MKIVILGGGLVGAQLARQLISEDKEVTIIEKTPLTARRITDRMDCKVIIGEGNSVPVLKKAGIEQANFFVSVTESDEINMIACSLVAAEYTEPVTVARVRNLGYSTTRMVRQRLYGIDHIINPEIEAARAVIRSLERGAVGTVNPFSESGLSMTSVTVNPNSSIIDCSVKDIRSSISEDFLLPLILRDNQSLIPHGNTRIKSNDMLYIIATPQGTDALLRAADPHHHELKRIAIVGGGRIGCYVADYLLGEQEMPRSSMGNWHRALSLFKCRKILKRSVHFIERDYEVGRELAEKYPQAMVSHSDISDEEVSETGLLEGYDLMLSATGNQELNLISALFAKNQGVARSIALVRKAAYVTLAQEMGIDVTVNISDTMVNSILSILRRGNIRNIYTIAGSGFEIVDLLLDNSSPIIGSPIKELKWPKDSLILVINRNNDYIIPRGDLELIVNDRLVVITPQEAVKQLEVAVSGK